MLTFSVLIFQRTKYSYYIMLSSKAGTLGLLFAILSLALCNPQRQGRGFGDVMENLWDGFSDHLDEFQVRNINLELV